MDLRLGAVFSATWMYVLKSIRFTGKHKIWRHTHLFINLLLYFNLLIISDSSSHLTTGWPYSPHPCIYAYTLIKKKPQKTIKNKQTSCHMHEQSYDMLDVLLKIVFCQSCEKQRINLYTSGWVCRWARKISWDRCACARTRACTNETKKKFIFVKRILGVF